MRSELLRECERTPKVSAKVTYGNNVRDLDDWQRSANPYTVTLRFRGRQITVPFFTGSGWDREPNAADVLSNLLSASATDESFEDWCAEFGYDTDSRRALDDWQACRDMARRLRRFLGDDWDRFAYCEH